MLMWSSSKLMTVLKMATENGSCTLEDTNLKADWVSLPVLTGDDCLLVVVQVGGKSNQVKWCMIV